MRKSFLDASELKVKKSKYEIKDTTSDTKYLVSNQDLLITN